MLPPLVESSIRIDTQPPCLCLYLMTLLQESRWIRTGLLIMVCL